METENKTKSIKGWHSNLNQQFEAYSKRKKELEESILKSTGDILSTSGFETPILILRSIYDFVCVEMEDLKQSFPEDEPILFQRVSDGVFQRVDFACKLIEILDDQKKVEEYKDWLELTEKGVLM